MQIIYGDASNLNLTAQKRLLRVVEGQTQATPYAGYLDPSLRETSGTIRLPLSSDTKPLARSANAFTYQSSLTPGLVLTKTTGENLCIHNGAEKITAFGLLGQWVGGTFDGVKQNNEISAWRGPDSVYDLLAPAWNDTGLAAQITAASVGVPVKLWAGNDGRLTCQSAMATQTGKTEKEVEEKFQVVAEVIERVSSSVLRINLLV